MSLVNRLAAPPAPKTNQTTLDRWLNEQQQTDKEAVLRAVVDPAWRHVDLLAALVDEGMPEVAPNTFGVWRRRYGYTA